LVRFCACLASPGACAISETLWMSALPLYSTRMRRHLSAEYSPAGHRASQTGVRSSRKSKRKTRKETRASTDEDTASYLAFNDSVILLEEEMRLLTGRFFPGGTVLKEATTDLGTWHATLKLRPRIQGPSVKQGLKSLQRLSLNSTLRTEKQVSRTWTIRPSGDMRDGSYLDFDSFTDSGIRSSEDGTLSLQFPWTDFDRVLYQDLDLNRYGRFYMTDISRREQSKEGDGVSAAMPPTLGDDASITFPFTGRIFASEIPADEENTVGFDGIGGDDVRVL
jgi:hypothetical protein